MVGSGGGEDGMVGSSEEKNATIWLFVTSFWALPLPQKVRFIALWDKG